MAETTAKIGLSWAPKIPSLSAKPKSGKDVAETKLASDNPLWVPPSKLVDGLFVPPADPRKRNKMLRKSRKDSAGSSWFDMPATTLTPEVKKDLELLKLRSYIDPKRFYKKTDTKSKELPKYFQMGTVIESTSDFFSSRLTKKERKATIADELLADESLKAYRKRKLQEINEAHQYAGQNNWKNKGTTKRRPKNRKSIQ